MRLIEDIPHYLQLMRVDKPVGWLLLLWPTLIALWIANNGSPRGKLIWVFALGVFVMRSAGCVINDYADRKFDPHVERTEDRPLASGALQPSQAIGLFIVLGLLAFGLLYQLPLAVWPWSIPAIILTIAYPYMKRIIQAPQLVLGLAFSFGIPMAYVASGHAFDRVFYLLMVINIVWVLVYDTQYAMSDREDDLKIGVNSTAILWGRYDRLVVALLQIAFMVLLFDLKRRLALSSEFNIGMVLIATLFIYQQKLLRGYDRPACFNAFLNNAWVGAILWFSLLSAL